MINSYISVWFFPLFLFSKLNYLLFYHKQFHSSIHPFDPIELIENLPILKFSFQMGFDLNRFQSTVQEEFICPICHDVLQEPVSLRGCEHVFCSKCINDWLQHNKKKICPIDRNETDRNQFQTPLRLFCNLLNELLIRCEFNECNQLVKLSDLDYHNKCCIYNPENHTKEIQCPNGN